MIRWLLGFSVFFVFCANSVNIENNVLSEQDIIGSWHSDSVFETGYKYANGKILETLTDNYAVNDFFVFNGTKATRYNPRPVDLPSDTPCFLKFETIYYFDGKNITGTCGEYWEPKNTVYTINKSDNNLRFAIEYRYKDTTNNQIFDYLITETQILKPAKSFDASQLSICK